MFSKRKCSHRSVQSWRHWNGNEHSLLKSRIRELFKKLKASKNIIIFLCFSITDVQTLCLKNFPCFFWILHHFVINANICNRLDWIKRDRKSSTNNSASFLHDEQMFSVWDSKVSARLKHRNLLTYRFLRVENLHLNDILGNHHDFSNLPKGFCLSAICSVTWRTENCREGVSIWRKCWWSFVFTLWARKCRTSFDVGSIKFHQLSGLSKLKMSRPATGIEEKTSVVAHFCFSRFMLDVFTLKTNCKKGKSLVFERERRRVSLSVGFSWMCFPSPKRKCN